MPRPVGELLAWDPVKQKEAWHASYPVAVGGGVLATAGNLVFQGRADGILAAYRATDGKQVWSFDAGTGIMAPPVTYQVDGVQYVSVLAGWGGPDGLGNDPGWGPVKPGYGRILTFKLGSNVAFKAPAYGHKEPAAGADHHGRYLSPGRASGEIAVRRQLRRLPWQQCGGRPAARSALCQRRDLEGIEGIVLGGQRAVLGMPSFKKILNPGQVRAIQAYIVSRARESTRTKRTLWSRLSIISCEKRRMIVSAHAS